MDWEQLDRLDWTLAVLFLSAAAFYFVALAAGADRNVLALPVVFQMTLGGIWAARYLYNRRYPDE